MGLDLQLFCLQIGLKARSTLVLLAVSSTTSSHVIMARPYQVSLSAVRETRKNDLGTRHLKNKELLIKEEGEPGH